MCDWVSPLPPGLQVGQVVYSTFERPDGSRITYASVVNGSYPIAGAWHYDVHGIDNGKEAHPEQPLGASCRFGETEK